MIKSLYPCFQHWSEGGSVWIISDPHFGETQIFGNEYDEYDDAARIKIYNKKIMKNDTFICLGDVGDVNFIPKINAHYKVLIKGNHDVGASKYEKYFNEVYSGPLVISEKIILSHEPIDASHMINIHGHNHNGNKKEVHDDKVYYNLAGNIVCFEPFNLGAEIKRGLLQEVISVHRWAIDKQTAAAHWNPSFWYPMENMGV